MAAWVAAAVVFQVRAHAGPSSGDARACAFVPEYSAMNTALFPDRPRRLPAMTALACACVLWASLPGGVVRAQQPSQPVAATTLAKSGSAVFSSAELDQ